MTNIPWNEDDLFRNEPSLGKGLGQQTGGTAFSDANEARKLLKMIEDAGGEQTVRALMGDKSADFYMRQLEDCDNYGAHYHVTGKQLFWLRDIKDRVV